MAALHSMLQKQVGSVLSGAAALPRLVGRAATELAATTPQAFQGVHPATAMQAVLRAAGSGVAAGAPSDAGAGRHPAAGVPGPPPDLEAVLRPLGSGAQAAAGSGTHSAVEVANDIFSALGIHLSIVHPTSANAHVRVSIAEDLGPKELDGRTDELLDMMTPQQFVQFMREASGSLRGCGLREYVEELTVEGNLEWVPGVPHQLSQKLYLDITRIIVFSFQRALLTLDRAEIWGHRLHVSMATPVSRFDALRLRNRKSVVGTEQLDIVVNAMMQSSVVHMPLVPQVVQRRLYRNCMTVVFLLLEDLLTGQNEGVSFMGHKLRFHLRPQSPAVVARALETQPITHCRLNEDVLNELVAELLNDPETNMLWVPDVIESQIYISAMRCVIRVVERVISGMQLSMLGRDINMSILSHIDVKHKQQRRKLAEREFEMYYGEENPMQSLTTTELHERLEDIFEQRRHLIALEELGSASFDLTEDVPMRPEEVGKRQKKASRDLAHGGAAAEEGVQGAGEAQPHEFQRLAHSVKLARTLHQTFEVDADIEVPYRMIADLETYNQWMPWCTSGRFVDNPKETPSPEVGEEYLHGQVGFGFETGTFLGTVGDTVFYRVKVRPPDTTSAASEAAGAEEAEGHEGEVAAAVDAASTAKARAVPVKCSVLADAVNGFTYGKRLVYDWRFTSLSEGRTKVELDMLFQAHNVLYMPIWDSMQNMVVNNMLQAFAERARVLQKSRGAEGTGT